MPIWDDVIPAEDLEVHEKAGYGGQVKLGTRPALLVVDVTYEFVGDKPEPILKSVERFPFSCGEEGWRAVNNIRELLDFARMRQVPILYSTGPGRRTRADARIESITPYADKHRRAIETSSKPIVSPDEIVPAIAPRDVDIVIRKFQASAFFGTTLVSYLVALNRDTLIVTGCTTSGCVRATVEDASAYNFRVCIPEECVFDRFVISHKVNLFDMNALYANVISLAQLKNYLQNLGE